MLVLATGVCLLAGAANASTTINHQFTPATINPGDVSQYRITIVNSSLVPLTAAAVTEILPAAVTIASPASITNTCGFTVNAASPGTSTVYLTGGTIPAGTGTVDGQCFFQLNVTSTTPGNQVATIPANSTPDATTSGYTALENGVPVFNTTPASATLAVATLSAPTGGKTFAPSPAFAGDTVALTITLTNPNTGATIPLTTFTDNLPSGMTVVGPGSPAVSCTGTGASNGTLTAASGASSVTLTGGTIGTSGVCTLRVNVRAVTSLLTQTLTNTVPANAIGNTRGLTSATFNRALVVNTPINVTKTFGTPTIPAGQPSVTTIVITNLSASNALDVTSFADSLAGTTLVVLDATDVPPQPNPALVCTGAGAISPAPTWTPNVTNSTLSIASARAGPSGTCTLTATMTSSVDGAHANAIPANAVSNPNGWASPAASATLTANAQLTVAKSAAPTSVAPGQWAQFTVTINNYSGGPVTGVTFKDVLPKSAPGNAFQMTLFDAGSGLFLPSPGCSGGTYTGTDSGGGDTTNPPAAGDFGLIWTGGTIAAGGGVNPGVCTISIWAQVPAGAGTGLTFTNSLLAGSVTGTGPLGGITNTNAASVNVVTIAATNVTKSFAPATVALGQASVLTITLFNRTVSPLTGVGLTDSLPAGLQVAANPLPTNACGGTFNPSPGATSFSLSGGTVAARPPASQESTCAFTVRVVGTSTGLKTNTIPAGALSDNEGASNPTAASGGLTISAGLTGAKTFTPTSVTSGGVARVKLTVTNATNGALTNVSIDDNTFSAGLVIANPSNAATNCAGSPTLVADPGTTRAQLLGATLNAGAACDFSFDVATSGAGPWSDTVPAGKITSAEGAASTAAVTATLTAAVAQININKSFNPVIVTGGQPSILQIDVTNSSSAAITGVGFTDAFPSGIVVYSVPAASTDCAGGTVTAAAGGGSVSLAGATLAASATCHVFVTTTSTKFLNLTNTIPAGAVTSSQGYTNLNPTSATLSTLQGLNVAKAFSPPFVVPGQVSTLVMTLVSTFDPSAPAPITLTGLTYTDLLPNGVFIAATPNPTTTCAGTGPGGLAVVSTANGGSNGSVTVTQATVSPGSTCTVRVDTVSNVLGAYNNTIPANSVTTDQGIPNQSPASATLFVVTTPTVSKSFANPTRNPGQTTTLTVTISNGTSVPLTGVALTDTLPAGVAIASTPATGGTCASTGGGVVTAVAGGGTLSVSGATIAAGSSCTFFATVVSNTPGVYVNQIPAGAIATAQGLSNAGPAQATLTVNSPPTVAKSFSPIAIDPGATSTLTITFGNPNASPITLSSLFTDTLPGSVVVAPSPGVATSCTLASVTANAGASSVAYASGASIPAGGCAISVKVTTSTAGTYTNVIAAGQLSTSVGVNQFPATASLACPSGALAAPTIAKSFAPAAIFTNGTSTLTITLGNPNASVLTLTSDFTDTLPANVTVSGAPGGTCPGSATTAAGSVTYPTGATISAGGCTVTVPVTSAVAGTYNNAIPAAALVTDGGSPTLPATAGLDVHAPAAPTVVKSFAPGTINPGAVSRLTITLGNANAASASLTAPFTDTLPGNVSVAASPNASTTCPGAAVSTGAASVTLTGGSVPPGACAVGVDVTSAVPGGPYTNTIPAGALQTSLGANTGAATDHLFVNPFQPPSVSKSFSPAVIGAGGVSRLAITLANANAASATLTADFVDVFPGPGLAIAAVPNLLLGPGCTAASVVANAGAASVTYQSGGALPGNGGCTIQVDVTSSTVRTYVNSIAAGAVQTTVGSNAVGASASLQVLALPTVAKSFTPAGIPLGGTSTLTLTFGNANAVPLALSADFVDTLPSNLVLGTPATKGGTCALASVAAADGGSTVTYASGAAIAAGGCTITVPVTSSVVGGYDNTTGPVATTTGSSLTGATAHLDVKQADLTILKTDGAATVVPGTATTYTIAVSNAGPSDVVGALVTDTLPAGIASATWTCAASPGSSCGAASGSGSLATAVNLLSGGFATYTVVANVSPSATGMLVNTAAVTPPADVNDPDLSNNTSTDTDTLTPQADLAITKTDGTATAVPGATTTYTIVASNAGPSAVAGAPVADVLPPAIVSATWTCAATAGSSCGTASGTGNVAANVSLLPGGAATFTVVATISQSATGTLTNTATIAPPAGVTDPNLLNDTATDTDALTPRADLAVTKTDGVANAVPGTATTYTVVFSNLGPSAAPGAAVADALPAAIASATWTCAATAGSSCGTASGAGSISDTVSLLSGGSATYTVTANVSPIATGTLVNTATIAPPGGVTDPVPGNNSATDTDTLVPQADLAITKTDGAVSVVPGTTTTYTIVVTNAGPSTATAAPVSDVLPAAIASATWTCAAAPGSTCGAASGTGNVATTVTLPAGGSATFSVVAPISPSATGTLVNTATVSAPAGVTDPNPANNSATDTDTLVPTADLSITKTDGVASVVPGTSTTYTIVVSNAGPSAVAAAPVLDVFPATIVSDTWTCVASPGSSCGAASGNGILAAGASLLPGGTATYTVTASVSAFATGTLVNTATVAAPAGVTDPNPGNNSATDTDTLVPTADLSITKTDGVASVVPGTSTTYTIVVSNAGPSAVLSAPVADPLPAGVTSATWTCAASGGGSCGAASGSGSIASNVSLPPGAAATYTLVATVASSATGALVNTATVAPPGGVTDPNPGDDSATDTDTLAPSADLAVVKTGPATAVPGGPNVTFSMLVTNDGPSDAPAVQLGDPTPANLSFVSASAPCAGGFPCALGALAKGASTTVTATYAVPSSYPKPAPIVNTATVSSTTGIPDPVSTNDSSTATVGVPDGYADLAVTKTVDVPAPAVGTNVTFTVGVKNDGPSDATSVRVTDVLPSGLTFVSASPSQGSYDSATGAWTVGSVVLNAAATLSIVATVTQPGTIVNTATVTGSNEIDPNPSNNSGTAVVNGPPAVADVEVSKTVDVATPAVGANVTFTVTATNAGPSAATGVSVTDVLPSGLTFVSAAPTQGGYSSGTGVWTIGTLPVGASVSLALVANVTAAGSYLNTATKTAENEFDPNPSNDTAVAGVVAGGGGSPQADLVLQKTDSPDPVRAGQSLTYTLVVTNRGPSDATLVQVVDPLPAGVTLVSASASQGGCSGTTTVTCLLGGLTRGASATVSVVVTVSAAAVPSISNTATVSANEPDPNPSDDVSTAPTTVQPVADVGLSKTVSNPSPFVTQPTTFTVTATNAGPSTATSVVVTDVLPANLGFASAAPSQGAYVPGTGVWTVGTLASGASATLGITAVALTPGAFTNTATKTGQTEYDPNPANDSASVSGGVDVVADLTIGKSHAPPTFVRGSSGTFTLTVSNVGTGPTTALVTVSDTLPAGLAPKGVSGSGWSCGIVAQTVTCTRSDALAVGASYPTIAVAASVAQAAPASVTNTATVSGGGDVTPGNDAATDTAPVVSSADLSIVKTGPPNAIPGADVVYTLVVTNNGPSDAAGVFVADPAPVNLTFVSNAGACVTAFPCSLGTVPAGASRTITATFALPANYTTPSPIVNTATVSSTTPDPNSSDDSSTAQTSVAADLSVAKTIRYPVTGGGYGVYDLVVTNHGPSIATNVVVTDPLPSNLAFVNVTTSQGSCAGGTTVTCPLGTMAVGAAATIRITVNVPLEVAPTRNTATVSADQYDPDPSNNTSSADLEGVSQVPTLSEWGLVLLGLALALAGARALRGGSGG